MSPYSNAFNDSKAFPKYDLPLQAVWYLKCRALTLEQYLDDTEMEEQVQILITHLTCLLCQTCQDVPTRLRTTIQFAVQFLLFST